jgi:hypothetical protein
MGRKVVLPLLVLIWLFLLPRPALAVWHVVPWTGETGLPLGLEVWGLRPADPDREAWGYPTVSPDRAAVREELARLEAAWPGLELTVYLIPTLAKSPACGKAEFIGGVYVPGARAVVIFGQPRAWVWEAIYDLEFRRIVRHEVGHAVWFQLMDREDKEAWAAQKGISLQEAVEEWARQFEASPSLGAERR